MKGISLWGENANISLLKAASIPNHGGKNGCVATFSCFNHCLPYFSAWIIFGLLVFVAFRKTKGRGLVFLNPPCQG